MASRPNRTAAKRYYTIARLVVKDLVIVFVAGRNNGQAQVWNRKKKRLEAVTATLAGAVSAVPHKWTQRCVAAGRRQDGQDYSCVYSPCECETCEYSPCDGSCY